MKGLDLKEISKQYHKYVLGYVMLFVVYLCPNGICTCVVFV